MHVPNGSTQDLDILDFESALVPTADARAYDPDRWVYVPDRYLDYRYLLGTKGRRPLICVGINPSTARPGALDNTLKSVERLALANGFDSFLMFNVYAQRATVPDHLDKEFNQQLHEANMAAFRYVLSLGDRPAVWAAWGTLIEKRPFLLRCLEDMLMLAEGLEAVWYKAGKLSKMGHPHHPLYLAKSSTLEPFDVISYCREQRLRRKSST